MAYLVIFPPALVFLPVLVFPPALSLSLALSLPPACSHFRLLFPCRHFVHVLFKKINRKKEIFDEVFLSFDLVS
ncbi:predicted protein [Arabidopsis lyrata subsp. lyrata]|uniref:Predicted protein n=1 Tax=Arabidopsis lyrata subsp. lyrata TaxID=81972 RepID=D7MSP1_ARALL|nr:predicted protein [Arabidopsis lyrata subsp. lyrata]